MERLFRTRQNMLVLFTTEMRTLLRRFQGLISTVSTLAGLLVFPAGAQTVDPLDSRFQPQSAAHAIPLARPSQGTLPTVWATDSLAKVQPNAAPGSGQWLSLSAARNEFESFQVHVHAGSNPVQMNVSVSNFVNTQNGQVLSAAANVAVFRESYLNVTTPSDLNGITGLVPDPLIPVRDAYFHEARNAFPYTVPAGVTQSAWIDIYVPPGASSGYYTGNATVMDGVNPIAIIPVQLMVWNFMLPATASLKSAFGMGFGSLASAAYGNFANFGQYPGSGGDPTLALELVHTAVAKFFLDHRVSIHAVVVNPTSPQGQWSQFDSVYGPLLDGTAPTILQGAQLTSISYAGVYPPSADSQDWISHFGLKGWLPRFFEYVCDEPPGGCTWANLASSATALHAVSPNASALVTTDIAKATTNGVINQIDILTPVVDFMHPMGGQSQRPSYDAWLQGSSIRQLWWYQSCDEHESCANGNPGPVTSTWPSYMVDASPMRNRIFQWLAYLYRIGGELYYLVEMWGDNPWDHLYFAGGNGDGELYYPGTIDKIGGSTPVPVASLRLKLIRDGMEDYEYLHALSQAGRDDVAQSVSNAFITNAYTFSNDPQQLRFARQTLGNQLHQLSLQPPPFSIAGLVPSSYTAGSADTSVTVNGANFAPGDTVRWAGPDLTEIALPTTYVNSGQLTATVSHTLLAQAGTVKLTVRRNAVLAATRSLLVIPNVPTTLGASIAGKTGPTGARVWSIQFTNNGPALAAGVQIAGLSFTQTAGAACTPVVGGLPAAIPSIAVGASATSPVTINFSSCTGIVRFKVTMPFTANGGLVNGTMVANNQVP